MGASEMTRTAFLAQSVPALQLTSPDWKKAQIDWDVWRANAP
jgi:hypothetical protein